jgi:hypothetical protein
MSRSSTRPPSKRDVVVLALADLGGNSQVIDTEDVAMRCYELAPKAFAWRKYPDQIDLDSVRVSLTDACKAKYGAHAAGSVRQGWHLTTDGVAWEDENGKEVRRALKDGGPSTRPEARLSTLHAAREAARVKSSPAYGRWSQGAEVPSRMAAAAFRVDSYTSPRDRNLKLNRLAEIAQELEDQELAEFVDRMTETVQRMSRVSERQEKRKK